MIPLTNDFLNYYKVLIISRMSFPIKKLSLKALKSQILQRPREIKRALYGAWSWMSLVESAERGVTIPEVKWILFWNESQILNRYKTNKNTKQQITMNNYSLFLVVTNINQLCFLMNRNKCSMPKSMPCIMLWCFEIKKVNVRYKVQTIGSADISIHQVIQNTTITRGGELRSAESWFFKTLSLIRF